MGGKKLSNNVQGFFHSTKKCEDYDSYFSTHEGKTIHIFFIKVKMQL